MYKRLNQIKYEPFVLEKTTKLKMNRKIITQQAMAQQATTQQQMTAQKEEPLTYTVHAMLRAHKDKLTMELNQFMAKISAKIRPENDHSDYCALDTSPERTTWSSDDIFWKIEHLSNQLLKVEMLKSALNENTAEKIVTLLDNDKYQSMSDWAIERELNRCKNHHHSE